MSSREPLLVKKAKFVTSGVSWGFFCSTPGVAIGRNLQRKHAMEMLLTGEPISAQRALEWGLLNRVVAVDDRTIRCWWKRTGKSHLRPRNGWKLT